MRLEIAEKTHFDMEPGTWWAVHRNRLEAIFYVEADAIEWVRAQPTPTGKQYTVRGVRIP